MVRLVFSVFFCHFLTPSISHHDFVWRAPCLRSPYCFVFFPVPDGFQPAASLLLPFRVFQKRDFCLVRPPVPSRHQPCVGINLLERLKSFLSPMAYMSIYTVLCISVQPTFSSPPLSPPFPPSPFSLTPPKGPVFQRSILLFLLFWPRLQGNFGWLFLPPFLLSLQF